ncbi:FAD-binding and (Fe-S)-binding domain-containing protein [Alteromonas sp. CYL-A6]|uniref:FAD-binding and (Fe-S)-binding domain-containing protein n=1 Tax=Alteromonas nitratireducens TaxID=3390813 RepID=UPI0034A72072
MVTNALHAFTRKVSRLLPAKQVVTGLAERLALSVDASFYSKTPALIVYVHNTQTMQDVIRLANSHRVALTFRAAGTSLSGQAITDQVLVMLTPDWQHHEIIDEGKQITLAPGIIGAKANRLLAPYKRKIGPDPASINSCKIGGIAANNASGMCCGVRNNSYHTLTNMTLILADGTRLDTRDAESVRAFRQSHAGLLAALSSLAGDVRSDSSLSERIRHQYRLKNTMGYGLNALLDFTDPVEILTHLMIGSEGTLGFIADITYRTIALPQARQTGLFLFSSARVACEAIPMLSQFHADAVELMDTRALRAVSPLLTPFYTGSIRDGNVALLIEFGAASSQALDNVLADVNAHLAPLIAQGDMHIMQPFTADPSTIDALWHIRKGLFPAVGAVRDTGTTVIIEDVAFALDSLADGLDALTALFTTHQINDAIIFGHALDGNLHFVFSQSMDADAIARYDTFMQDVATLVTVKFNGSLKAEHGTGRNMAPFLSHQWGEDGVAVMRRIKQCLDPAGILNPGVILNDDPKAHIRDVKALPAVDERVDKCIECGFCEASCPSSHYTLSPRQRIALMRRAQSLEPAARHEVDSATSSLVRDSCAATGMCAPACPVGINTGDWVTTLRQQQAKHGALARFTAQHYGSITALARGAVSVTKTLSDALGSTVTESATRSLNRLTHHRIPVFIQEISGAGDAVSARTAPRPDAVYVPACPARLFGDKNSEHSLTDVVLQLAEKAGLTLVIPEGLNDACCGQPFDSKGYPGAGDITRASLKAILDKATDNGRLPVVMDASPCASTWSNHCNGKTFELSEYLLSFIVPRIKITPTDAPVMLHVTCSSRQSASGNALRTLTHLCSTHVSEPDDIQCCGFAGDKGLLLPDLNKAALASLREQVPPGCQQGVSNSMTCELGLTRHSGVRYRHIAFLLNAVSQPLTR